VQRVQESPATVIDFVIPLAQAMRARNPDIQVGVQVSALGDIDQVLALIRQLAPAVDGISVLTDHDSVDFSAQLVSAMRPASFRSIEETGAAETVEKNTVQPTTPTTVPLPTMSTTLTPEPIEDGVDVGSNRFIYRLGFFTLIIFGIGIAITALLHAAPSRLSE
jgi:hypothetical protein